MRQYIQDEQIKEALRENDVIRNVLLTLKKLEDPLDRARVLRAVAALHGLDE